MPLTALVAAMLALIICAASAGEDGNSTKAEAANREALQLAGRRNLAESIRLFREAVDLAPAKPEYHNNLGVALMRVGRMADARQQFLRSLFLSGMQNDDAESNLADLFAYTGANAKRAAAKDGLPQDTVSRISDLVKSRKATKAAASASKKAGANDQQRKPAQEAAKASQPAVTSGTTDLKVEATHRAVSRLAANSTLRDAAWRRSFGSLRHRVQPIPRIPAAEMHLPKHFRLMSGTAPFLVTGLFDFWKRRKQQHRVSQQLVASALKQLERARLQQNATLLARLRRNLADARASALSLRRGSWPGSSPDDWATSHRDWSLAWLVGSLGLASGDYYPGNLKLNGHPSIVTVTRAVQELVGAGQPSYLQFNLASGHWFDAVAPRLGPLPWLFAEDDSWLDGCFGGVRSDPDGAGWAADTTLWASSDPAGLDFGRGGITGTNTTGKASGGTSADPDRGRSGAHGGGRHRGLASEHFISSHWRMLLLGSKHAGMFNHKDTLQTLSYQVQLQGAKRWHLCSSENDPILSAAQGAFGKASPTQSRVSLFQPDYERLPGLAGLDCFADDVLEGEAVFYPREYWHETDNLYDYTMAITGTLSARENAQHVMRQLRASCQEAAGKGQTRAGHAGWAPLDMIKPSADLCRHYERCALWSEVAYGSRADNWEPFSPANATAAWLTTPQSADMVAAATRVTEAAQEAALPHAPAPGQDPARAGSVQEWAGQGGQPGGETCPATQGTETQRVLRQRGRSRQLADARRG